MDQKRDSQTREHLARLWGKAEASVQAYVFSAVSGFQDAEDMVQEVAMTVARRFHEYDPSRPFVGWALWLAKSHIVDHYRKRGRERLAFSDLLLDQIAAVLVERQRGAAGAAGGAGTVPGETAGEIAANARSALCGGKLHRVRGEEINSTAGSVRVMLFRVRDVWPVVSNLELARAEIESNERCGPSATRSVARWRLVAGGAGRGPRPLGGGCPGGRVSDRPRHPGRRICDVR